MKKARIGLLANAASVDRKLCHTADGLISQGFQLKALFSPQHGFAAHTQANMIEVDHGRDTHRGIPIFSLYGEVRKPTPDMLEGMDWILVDLQDVGARGYTFVWTMLLMMEAAAEAGVSLRILDRPNPINGVHIEGPLLRSDFFSFVGMHAIPIRHAMTLGELAQMFAKEKKLDLDLTIKRMPNWNRKHFFPQTGRPWVMPSPNIPTVQTTLVYPGMELLEGTNLSEGRGTTRPFELFGAPFINSKTVCHRLAAFRLPGVIFRPASFVPTFDKWKGHLCHGAQIHVCSPNLFRSVKTTVAIIKIVMEEWPKGFSFLPPPYEYEEVKLPFDILAGSDLLRKQLSLAMPLAKITDQWDKEHKAFRARRRPFLLY